MAPSAAELLERLPVDALPLGTPSWATPDRVVAVASASMAAAPLFAVLGHQSAVAGPRLLSQATVLALLVPAVVGLGSWWALRAHAPAHTWQRLLLAGCVGLALTVSVAVSIAGARAHTALMVPLLLGVSFGAVMVLLPLSLVATAVEAQREPSHDGADWVLSRCCGHVVLVGTLASLPLAFRASVIGALSLAIASLGVLGLAAGVRRRWHRVAWWLRISRGNEPHFFVALPEAHWRASEVLPLLRATNAGPEVVVRRPSTPYRDAAELEPVCLAPAHAPASRSALVADALVHAAMTLCAVVGLLGTLALVALVLGAKLS